MRSETKAQNPAAKSAATGTRRKAPAAPERVVANCDDPLSHNLYGQRLGRKGRDTRERIIAAAQTLLARDEPAPITLSAVAREASLGMTTLYLYFSDLTELLLAVMEPVMATADEVYITPMRTRWPDEALGAHCHAFILAYCGFWTRYSRILHLRNAIADQHDLKMMMNRVDTAQALINMVVEQMDCDPRDTHSRAYDMATVLITGVERVVTMSTDLTMQGIIGTRGNRHRDENHRLHAVARLLELGIKEHRDLGQNGEGR